MLGSRQAFAACRGGRGCVPVPSPSPGPSEAPSPFAKLSGLNAAPLV